MRKMAFLALLSTSAIGAEIYYDDGTHVTVPDDWVVIRPPVVDCSETPEHPKCWWRWGWVVDEGDEDDKLRRQQEFLRGEE